MGRVVGSIYVPARGYIRGPLEAFNEADGCFMVMGTYDILGVFC